MSDVTECENTTHTASPGLPLLPPCRICGGKASGFHYGANTCEACKAFFRGSEKRKRKYKCLRSGNCEIGRGQRNMCSFCRYQKCVAVGMCRTAIKIGRYTLQKRTEIILEMKTMEKKKQAVSDTADTSVSSTAEPWIKSSGWDRQPASDFEEMVTKLMEAHKKVKILLMSDEEIEEMQRRYLDSYNLKLNMFGSLSILPREQYEEIYRITGLDVDNRQWIMGRIAQQMERRIREIVTFVKGIPGFSDLTLDDQSNLVKASKFEFEFLGNFRGFNHELKMIVTPLGKCFHLDQASKFFNSELLSEMLMFANTLKNLHLGPEEIVILRTICVVFTDRCQLQEPDRVEEIQWKLVQCLKFLLERNHEGDTGLFARVMDRLTAIRDLTEKKFKVLRDMEQWPAVQANPLLVEMFA